MLVMGYLGAVIGAGFASGQEIVQFFVVYGTDGLKGSITAAFLFAACGGLLLYVAHSHQISNYQDMLSCLLGDKTGKIIDLLLAVFLFLGISMMLSASGAVFSEHLHLPKLLGVLVGYGLVIMFLVSGKRGLVFSYNLLVPLKLLLLATIAGYAAFFVEGAASRAVIEETNSLPTQCWLLSSILYVAYNFALAMVVLTEYKTVASKRGGITGAAMGGIVLGALVLLCYLALAKFFPVVLAYEVPMLYIIERISIQIKNLYTIVLWVGIITTAIANAYGFSQRFSKLTGLRYNYCLVLCTTTAIPTAMCSFSILVAKVYPVFGILGLVILIALIYKAIKEMAEELGYSIVQ